MKIVFLGNFNVEYSSENHYKEEFEALGHEVVALQEPFVTAFQLAEKCVGADMFFWIHTHGADITDIDKALTIIKGMGIPCVAYHLDLYMGLKRWQQYKNHPYMHQLDYFFTVDKKMAEWLCDNTSTKGVFLPAGIVTSQIYTANPKSEMTADVTFIGAKQYHEEWPYRPQLINWLQKNYPGFVLWGRDGRGQVRQQDMNHAYASAKIAIGDTLCPDFTYPYYLSDRIFNMTGAGAFTIHPYIEGIGDLFELDKEIVTYPYGRFDRLKEKIDYYLEHPEEREAIAKAGQARTLKDHTYRHRMQTIIDEVTR
jgi:hypothetical protein